MKRGKHEKPGSVKPAKVIALASALLLLICCTVGGTLAWLVDGEMAINIFTVGNIDITQTDTGAQAYQFVPGNAISRAPKVTVKAGSSASYLFVRIEEISNYYTLLSGRIIDWSVADGWTPVTGHHGFWYRAVDAADTDTDYYILKDDQVTVNSGVTMAMVSDLETTNPQIRITAAAVQQEALTDWTAAWNALPVEFTGTTESGS